MRPFGMILSLAVHCGALGGALVVGVRWAQRTERPVAHVEVQAATASTAARPQPPEPPPVAAETTVADAAMRELAVAAAETPLGPQPDPSPVEPVAVAPDSVWLQPWCRAKVAPAAAVPLAAAAAAEAVAEPDRPPPEPSAPPAPASAHVEARPCADNAPPEYPQDDRMQGHEGTVVVLVRLDARGRVLGAELDAPSPYPGLNRAALRAVSRWRFEPACHAGVAAPSELRVPIEFRLTSAGAAGRNTAADR